MVKHILFIVASQGYQPIEYSIPRKLLESFGAKVFVASDNTGSAVATDNSTAHVDFKLDQVDVAKYDAIVIVGGPGALEHLDKNITHQIIAQAFKLNRVIGAICIAPRILLKAGILHGKRATGWNDDKQLHKLYKDNNVTYDAHPVVVDTTIITASGPIAAPAFGEALVTALKLK